MVPIKNATARVSKANQLQNVDGVLENPEYTLSGVVSVYFEESSPEESFQVFAAILDQPAFIQAELADRDTFAPNAQVVITLKGQTDPYGTYFVVGTTEQHFVANDADHLDIYIAKSQYPS